MDATIFFVWLSSVRLFFSPLWLWNTNKDNVECVMCDFQHVQISVEVDVIGTWRRLLRSESFSTAPPFAKLRYCPAFKTVWFRSWDSNGEKQYLFCGLEDCSLHSWFTVVWKPDAVGWLNRNRCLLGQWAGHHRHLEHLRQLGHQVGHPGYLGNPIKTINPLEAT